MPTSPAPRIALLTEARFLARSAPWDDPYLANLLHEDHLLQAALARRGVATERVAWDGPRPDWGRFDGALVRTTWNYSRQPEAFAGWLEEVAARIPLSNPLACLRWNLDKAYLADLAREGLPVVPSRFIEPGEALAPSELFAQTGWEAMVLKPRVSGGGRLTHRLGAGDGEAPPPELLAGMAREPFIAQPFQAAVLTEGEDSLMLFGGRYSHAVRKRPKGGEFRVQDDFGGSVARHRPEPAQCALAEAALAAAGRLLGLPPFAYGRVDLVRGEDGAWRIMELELLEPELWLRQHPPAAEAFAAAVLGQLGG